MRALLLALFFGLCSALPAHNHEAQVKEAEAKAKAALADAGQAVQIGADKMHDAVVKGEALIQAEPLTVLKASAGQHLHNKLVHFPIALGLFGVLFFLLSARWAAYLWPSRVLLATAAVGAFAAMTSGWAQRDVVEGTSLIETFEWHEHLGQASTALLALSLLLSFFPSARKWSWVIMLAAVAAVLVTGALGGALAHS